MAFAGARLSHHHSRQGDKQRRGQRAENAQPEGMRRAGDLTGHVRSDHRHDGQASQGIDAMISLGRLRTHSLLMSVPKFLRFWPSEAATTMPLEMALG